MVGDILSRVFDINDGKDSIDSNSTSIEHSHSFCRERKIISDSVNANLESLFKL